MSEGAFNKGLNDSYDTGFIKSFVGESGVACVGKNYASLGKVPGTTVTIPQASVGFGATITIVVGSVGVTIDFDSNPLQLLNQAAATPIAAVPRIYTFVSNGGGGWIYTPS